MKIKTPWLVTFFLICVGLWVVLYSRSSYQIATPLTEEASSPPFDLIIRDNDGENILGLSPMEKTLSFSEQLNRIVTTQTANARDVALAKLFRQWMAIAPEDALEAISLQGDAATESLLYVVAIPIWFHLDSYRFEEWLAALEPNAILDPALEILLGTETTSENFALRYVEKISDKALKERVANRLIDRWLQKDMYGLITWSAYDEKYQHFLPQIFALLTRRSAVDAIENLTHLVGVDETSLSAVVEQVAINFGVDALSDESYHEIRQLPQNGIQEQVLVMLFPALANSIPEEEIANVVVGLPDTELKSSLTKRLSKRWAQTDPHGAATFAAGVSNETDRRKAINIVVNEWLQIDPSQAALWLSSIDGNINSAAAAMAYYSAKSGDMPIKEQTWLSRIDDHNEKSRVLLRIANDIYQNDPIAMYDYIAAQDILSESELSLVQQYIFSGVADN